MPATFESISKKAGNQTREATNIKLKKGGRCSFTEERKIHKVLSEKKTKNRKQTKIRPDRWTVVWKSRREKKAFVTLFKAHAWLLSLSSNPCKASSRSPHWSWRSLRHIMAGSNTSRPKYFLKSITSQMRSEEQGIASGGKQNSLHNGDNNYIRLNMPFHKHD